MTQGPQNIIIIGAGLGGLCLAQGLKRNGIPFRIFERDASAEFRAQGYRISINAMGAAALKANLTPELWSLFEASCAVSEPGLTRFNAQNATELPSGLSEIKAAAAKLNPSGVATKPYIVDRTIVRRLLMIGLDEELAFSKSFSHYTLPTPTTITAHFSDATTATGTLLVAADGAHSHARRQALPAHTLLDTTGRTIYGKSPLNPALVAALPEAMLRTMTGVSDTAASPPVALIVEPVRFHTPPSTLHPALPATEPYVYWALAARAPAFPPNLLSLPAPAVAALTLHLSASWDPTLRALLEGQDAEQTAALALHTAPPGLDAWAAQGVSEGGRVTFVGDAVHVMSPTAGSGANTALRDAAGLCEVLVQAREGGEGVDLEGYEGRVREYAGAAIEASAMGGRKIFGMPGWEGCLPVVER